MWVTAVWLGFSVGPLALGPGFIPEAWTDFLVGYHAQSWYRGEAGGRGLVLLQLGMPGFVDSPREALPFLWSERRVGEGRGGGGGRRNCGWCAEIKKFKDDFQRVLLNTKMMKHNSHNRLIFKWKGYLVSTFSPNIFYWNVWLQGTLMKTYRT